MSKLTIVAHIHAHPDQVDGVLARLKALVASTRAEEGCLQYDLHQDDEDPAHFLFYENWESRERWQAHMETPHIAAWREFAEGAVASFAVHRMTHIA